jgi:hypothetical protein
VLRLRLSEIEANDAVGLDAKVDVQLEHNDWRVARVEDDLVVLRRGGIETPVPLAYVEAVYRAGLQDAEWMVALSCVVSRHRRRSIITVTKEIPFGRNEGHYRSRGMDAG